MPRSFLAFTWVDIWESYSNPYNLEKGEFRDIIATFNHLLMRDVVDNGALRKLPYGLGFLYVGKRLLADTQKAMENEVKQWQNTHPLFYAAYTYTQEKYTLSYRHSGNYVARIKWSKFRIKSKNKTLFMFTCNKFFRKHMAYMIREKNTMSKYWEFK